MHRLAISLCSLSLIVGCGPSSDGDGSDIIHDGECKAEGFEVSGGQALFGRRSGKEFLSYTFEGEGARYDRLEFTSFLLPEDDGVPLPAGKYVLSAEHGNEAEPMVRAFRDCEDGECNEIYQATGELEIISSSAVGGTFKARLNNVTFEEMEEDGSEPKRDGSSFCGSAVRWDAPVESNVLGNCSAEGDGSAKGDRLRDLVLPNCYGDDVAVHDNCGHVKAQVIVLTAGWCGACQQRLPVTETEVQQYKDQGQKVDAFYVLGNGGSRGSIPTQQECFGGATSKNIDPARMLMDTGGGRVGFNETLRKGWADNCDSGLPYYFVLDGDDMSYNFGSRCEDDPRSQQGYKVAIEELLDD